MFPRKKKNRTGTISVVVADSGLRNKTNVELLRQAGYKYILGARIKKEPADIVEWLLAIPY